MPEFSVLERDLTHCPEVNAMVDKAKENRDRIKRAGDHEDMEACKDVARYMVNQARDNVRTTSNYDPPPEKLFRNMTREQRIAEGWSECSDGSWVKR